MEQKVKFSSRFSTYVTLLGYSVGQSDFWRFPFLAYRNGGGSFIFPFMLILFLCGIPMYYLEYATSKFSGKGPYRLYDMCPLFKGIGITVAIGSYVFIICPTIFRAWLIEFFINAFKDPLPWSHCNNTWNTDNCRQTVFDSPVTTESVGHNRTLWTNETNVSPVNGSYVIDNDRNGTAGMTAAEEFWQYKVLELSSGVTDLYPILWRHMGSSLFQRVLVCIILIKSIKWIEKVMYVTTFVPFILTVAVFLSSLCQPGAAAGLYHYFYPNFDMLMEIRVWIEACLMVIYTISFGWGIIPMLGSHTEFRENPLRIAILLPIFDALFAVFTGMVCFSVLGNMAHNHGVDVKDVIQAGMSAGIVSYVTALTSLPFPQIWAVFFFFSVLLTSLDTQMMCLELAVQVAGEVFPKLASKYRLHTLGGLSALAFVLSLPVCTGAGVYIFLFVDWYIAAWIGPIVAFVEIVVVAWIYGMEQFCYDVTMMTGRPIASPLRVTLAFITPLIVMVVFISSCVNYVPPSYGSYHYPVLARVFGWLSIALMTSPILVYAIYNVMSNKGGKSCLSTTKERMEPNFEWGPAEEELRTGYTSEALRFRGRTLKQTFSYNLTGSYSKSESEDVSLQNINML